MRGSDIRGTLGLELLLWKGERSQLRWFGHFSRMSLAFIFLCWVTQDRSVVMCKLKKQHYIPIDERWRRQIQNSFRNVPLTSAAKSLAAATSFRTETQAHRKKHSTLLQFSTVLCQLYQDLLWTICVTQRWVLTWTLNYGNAVAPLSGLLFEIHTWIHHSSNFFIFHYATETIWKPRKKHVLLLNAFSEPTSPSVWIIHYLDSVHCSL